MTISERINSFGANSLLLPVVLWGPKAPKSRIVRISSVQNGRIILTGSIDGQLMQWVVDEALGWIQPQMVLLAHESAISCISPICRSNTSKFVTCSEDGTVCLWDSIDGRVIDSVKSNFIHRTIKPYTLKNGAQNVLFCIGDYADVIVLHPYDLNVLFTLGSKIEPEWTASIALATPMDVLVGTSLSGIVKLWSLHNVDPKDSGASVSFECESKVLATGADGVKSIVCSPKNLRMMLIVCGNSWQIIDPSTLDQLIVSECAIEALDGVIVDIDKVAIAFADSTIVLFQLPRKKLCGRQIREKFGENPTNVFNIEQAFVFALLKGTLSTPLKPSLTPVQFFFDESRNSDKKVVVAYRVDEQGAISMWHIPNNLDFLVNEFIRHRRPIVYEPTIKQHISEAWARLVPPPPTLVDTEDDERIVTATIYVGTQGKLFHGRDDGSIMMMNACHAIMAQLLEGFSDDCAPFRLLSDGHSARVICFSYPFADSARYDPNLLLSGGADFAVCVWNITTGERMHRFCCQGGPIRRFLIPPPNCSTRVLHSVCAIADDNSAALLSLKELKCILLASRQQFPIVDVRWRPLDDFLLLRCEDSSVYVWQIETANLDRIVAGLTTDEVMDATGEQLVTISAENGDDAVENGQQQMLAGATSQTVQMLRALKQHRNIAALGKIAGAPFFDAKNASASAAALADHLSASVELLIRLSPPMEVLHLRNCSDKAHLVLFNIDSLITGLLLLDYELCATESEDGGANFAATVPPPPNIECLSGAGTDSGRALLNTLISRRIAAASSPLHHHPHQQDNGIAAGHCHPHFDGGGAFPSGLVSAARNAAACANPRATCVGGGASLLSPTFLVQQQSLYMDTAKLLVSLLHGWDLDEEVDRACMHNLKLCRPKLPICFGTITKKGNLSLYTPHCSGKIAALDDFSYKYFSRSIHWHESRALTTAHLLSVVALSNTLMTLKSKSNQLAIKKPPLKRTSSIKSTDFLPENECQLIRQGWSNVAALHCVLLPELIRPSDAYATPRIDLLARKWQDNCIEIRDAAQALLIRELTRMGGDGRRRLIERWSNFLPTLLDPSISIFGTHFGGAGTTSQLSTITSGACAVAAHHSHGNNTTNNIGTLQDNHHQHHVAFVEEKPSPVMLKTTTGHQHHHLHHHLSATGSFFQMDSTVANSSNSVASSTASSTTTTTATAVMKLVPPPRPAVPPIPPRTVSSGALPSLLPPSSMVGAECGGGGGATTATVVDTSGIGNDMPNNCRSSPRSSLTSNNKHNQHHQHKHFSVSQQQQQQQLAASSSLASSSAAQCNSSSLSSLDDPYQQCASSTAIANKLQEDQMLLCGGVHQVHRNQATAIVLLGAMGAEFPSDLQRNTDLCRATALSLLELLLVPESPLLPANSPLRRAAIDLLGRGFVLWQPHLDLSKTILGLLNLASAAAGVDEEKSDFCCFPTKADACKTARHALSLIALSRPQALITTLSTEVARYNAVAQHQTIQHTIQSPLMRARHEVLRLLEQLSDKQYNFVVDLIIPVGEVLVHCLDLSLLKQRSLFELFPAIAKFYMVAYCPNTRRLAFGGKNGAIIVHELRASKAQTVQAHRAPITALAFSLDGKYLAAYAAQDAKISFWQTQQTFLGMGQSQIRCTKSVPAPGEFPVISPGGSYQPFRARLVWINSKSLTLMLPNGKENRFTI